MNMERTAAFKKDDLVRDLLIDIEESLEFRYFPGECCIYRVPVTIRRVNEKLYTQLISIGPLHYGKPELADMEKQKKQYLKTFFEQTPAEKRDEIISFIKDNEENIRACYIETPPLESHQFIRMVLYDSIFIIEVLRNRFDDRWDIFLDTVPIIYSLWTDLQLFENQLPYFVLEAIYKLAFDGDGVPTFRKLSIHFFGCFMGVRLSDLTPELKVKHFTDWRRISLLKNYQSSELRKAKVRDLPCAVKLHESGLKFKSIKIEEKQSLLDVRFKKSKHLISFFEINELQIPQLEVFDETECLLQNIMALEQCLYPYDAQVCNYIALMDCLINTTEDVDLLVENKIISNYMGDNASVATMFNRLNQCVVAFPSSYHNVCEELKKHYDNRWNKIKAKTKIPWNTIYFSNPLTGAATLGAILILLLTIIQTVCSILQVVKFN